MYLMSFPTILQFASMLQRLKARLSTGVKHTVLPDGQPPNVAFTLPARLFAQSLMKRRWAPPRSPKMVREGTFDHFASMSRQISLFSLPPPPPPSPVHNWDAPQNRPYFLSVLPTPSCICLAAIHVFRLVSSLLE